MNDVEKALEGLKAVDLEYWESLKKEVPDTLNWTEMFHPDIAEGCRVFVAPKEGALTGVELTTNAALEIIGAQIPLFCAVLGPEGNQEIVYTLHRI
jgi:hypothetical protein